MKKHKQFLLKISNQSREELKYVYKQKLLNEIENLYELFDNKSETEIIFFNSHKELTTLLDYKVVSKYIKGFTIDDTVYILKFNKKFYNNITEFESILLHEIIHALIYKKVNQHCPLWLNEGLALILSKQYKSISYECFLDFDYNLSSYNCDCFYEKCCAKTISYIKQYGKKLFITNLIMNRIKF